MEQLAILYEYLQTFIKYAKEDKCMEIYAKNINISNNI